MDNKTVDRAAVARSLDVTQRPDDVVGLFHAKHTKAPKPQAKSGGGGRTGGGGGGGGAGKRFFCGTPGPRQTQCPMYTQAKQQAGGPAGGPGTKKMQ